MAYADHTYHQLLVENETTVADITPKGKTMKITREKLNNLYTEYYSEQQGQLNLLRQSNVEYKKAKRSVLFLDEFNRAPQDILNASLQLILEHRLHSHILPIVRGQETLIVAAINPSDGDYTVQEFDPALLDRFIECEAVADLPSWVKWAKAEKVNGIVIDFLLDNEKKFHFTPKDGSKGASPRSWTRLSKFIDNITNTPKGIVTDYVKGTIGTALAAQFLHFYNNYSEMTSLKEVEKLINDKVTDAKKAGDVINPSIIALTVENQVKELDVSRRSEFSESLIGKYIDKGSFLDAMPMLVFLYALPLESLSATLKYLQMDNIKQYAALAKLDKAANNKGLFKKTVASAIV